jgi:diadenylate cyclase
VGLQEILWTIQNIPRSWQNILDVLLVAVIFFLFLQLVRGTRAATLLRGIAILLILVWALSAVLNLRAFSWLLSRTLTALAVALPVIFQEELRHWLDRLGRSMPLVGEEAVREDERERIIDEIRDAARHLSRRRHGALIVLERETGLQEYIESGTLIDASLSSDLLQTIFFPGTTLHDGAVIIRGEQVVAAACTLPISAARHLPDRQMGLRHRASLGISEVSDAVTVVVSEETGRISVVVGGRFIRGIDANRLGMILGEYIRQRQPSRLSTWLDQVRGVARHFRKAA